MKNAFAKLILIVFAVFACANIAASQEICEFSTVAAPLFFNLQLGMSPEQAQTAIGGTPKIKIKKNGERVFFQNYIKNPAPESLKNVQAIYLRFFDRQLYQIEIFYELRAGLPNLESITQILSRQLSFQVENWQIKNSRAVVICSDKSLKTDNILNPHVELTDEKIRRTVEETRRRAKK